MDEKLQDAIVKCYPKLFRAVRYMENGDGWHEIIEDMCAEINHQIESKQTKEVYFTQIKEKFGTLRVYFVEVQYPSLIRDIEVWLLQKLYKIFGRQYYYRSTVDLAIMKAEERSAHTCEICGKLGSTRTDIGWLTTLCDEHHKERLDGYKKTKGKTSGV